MKSYTAQQHGCPVSKQMVTDAAIMIAILSLYVAVVSHNEMYSLRAFSIIGGIAGGLAGTYVYGDITLKERGLRWLVNIATSFFLGIPCSRLMCHLLNLDLDVDMACLGGGLMGVFGVAILILVKKSLPSILNLILRIKGVKLQLKSQDDENESNNK